jgi:hypothetical protein
MLIGWEVNPPQLAISVSNAGRWPSRRFARLANQEICLCGQRGSFAESS